jgi:hypothetical protein
MSVPHFGHVQPMIVAGGAVVFVFFGGLASFAPPSVFETLSALSS